MEKNLFLQLLRAGKARLTDDGLIISLGEAVMMMPVRTFLFMQSQVIHELGKRGKRVLFNIGYYQSNEAVKRYVKEHVLDIKRVNKEKLFNFFLKLSSMLGLGVFEVIHLDFEEKKLIIRNSNLPTAKLYLLTRGKSKTPIDCYICGLFVGGFSPLFEVELECLETKCIACGDPYCQFELRPKKAAKR